MTNSNKIIEPYTNSEARPQPGQIALSDQILRHHLFAIFVKRSTQIIPWHVNQQHTMT